MLRAPSGPAPRRAGRTPVPSAPDRAAGAPPACPPAPAAPPHRARSVRRPSGERGRPDDACAAAAHAPGAARGRQHRGREDGLDARRPEPVGGGVELAPQRVAHRQHRYAGPAAADAASTRSDGATQSATARARTRALATAAPTRRPVKLPGPVGQHDRLDGSRAGARLGQAPLDRRQQRRQRAAARPRRPRARASTAPGRPTPPRLVGRGIEREPHQPVLQPASTGSARCDSRNRRVGSGTQPPARSGHSMSSASPSASKSLPVEIGRLVRRRSR